jgi:hypothetical protein
MNKRMQARVRFLDSAELSAGENHMLNQPDEELAPAGGGMESTDAMAERFCREFVGDAV